MFSGGERFSVLAWSFGRTPRGVCGFRANRVRYAKQGYTSAVRENEIWGEEKHKKPRQNTGEKKNNRKRNTCRRRRGRRTRLPCTRPLLRTTAPRHCRRSVCTCTTQIYCILLNYYHYVLKYMYVYAGISTTAIIPVQDVRVTLYVP